MQGRPLIVTEAGPWSESRGITGLELGSTSLAGRVGLYSESQ
jgi:hypothetical protein